MNAKQPIRISISESKGPVERLARTLSDGTVVETIDWGTTCPGCDKIPTAGQKITRIFYAWWHATCGAAYLRSTAADEAWLALGHQLERAPSKFSTAETKGIVRNLLRLAGAAGVVQERVDSRSLHGAAVETALPASDEEEFADVVDGFHHSDLYAAFLQVEQRHPGELPVVAGVRMWSLLDREQQARYTNEVLGAYVELVRIQRTEDREEGL
ncbi:hypothetical protein PV383_37285 [Streptomyces caniscabiei]|uniref:Uncharacterized protein n=1 Tax=Streptomyces caniscabiei TaxID=2746961 RepID=A0ABU4MZ37_9ACTN|nr:hypothetical protein [Streptomyces caniscabiei]MDX2948178.1 hypothetical protein [Streptomyces caniscabiei]MDX3042790.1 hypothetical protein [Streptomyces caniscabiei]